MSKKLTYILFFTSLLMNNAFAKVKNEGEYSPEISPNGEYLVYHSNSEEHFFDVFVKDLKTGESSNITNNKAYDTDASWSPDSKQLVFASSQSGQWDIYLYDLDKKTTKLLISDPAMDNQPIWSPNGKTIAFLSRRAGNSQIYLYDIQTKTQKRLTNTEHHIFHPSWTSHGRSVIFDQNIDGKSQIFQVALANGQIAKLYEGKGSTIAAERYKDKLYITTKRDSGWDIIEHNITTEKTRDLAASKTDEMKANIDVVRNRMTYSKTDSDGIPRVVIEDIK